MPNGDKLKPKTTREHLLSIYGYITGLKNDVKHMHDGIHDLGGKIDKIYWVLLGLILFPFGIMQVLCFLM